ncbi:hypothetical protein CONPUDRAFT_75485 [Coniophora puteana RWD-64-598 SS2]|uniref:Uncharacterized protein n=1 Tax=Coniophora puteana (strain RWD-64-598) TaxID=741705 RepID=A0A5M3MF79_CONPW|nr:uncharacterized protein CONPUDRAFT_75485 [Coniophora puteana RWD-64-598 SS2]EIW77656.1 hypothetical protein CONPUDRAFT_75485 [Coniophora puteana RWD-64-598 SS2]
MNLCPIVELYTFKDYILRRSGGHTTAYTLSRVLKRSGLVSIFVSALPKLSPVPHHCLISPLFPFPASVAALPPHTLKINPCVAQPDGGASAVSSHPYLNVCTTEGSIVFALGPGGGAKGPFLSSFYLHKTSGTQQRHPRRELSAGPGATYSSSFDPSTRLGNTVRAIDSMTIAIRHVRQRCIGQGGEVL